MRKQKFAIWDRNRSCDDGPWAFNLTEEECFKEISKIWLEYNVPFEDLYVSSGIYIGDIIEETESDRCPYCAVLLNKSDVEDDTIHMWCDFCGYTKHEFHISERTEEFAR